MMGRKGSSCSLFYIFRWIMIARIVISEVPVCINFHLEGTMLLFKDYLKDTNCEAADIQVEEEDLTRYPLICPDGILRPVSEKYMLMAHVSNHLLHFNRILMHGTSFLWQGRAWMFTAQSGTGKTTQLNLWKMLRGKEIEVINGDKTIVEAGGDHNVWLHPSPWTGKEGDNGTKKGKLAGIIVLEQAKDNEMVRLTIRDAVLPIYQEFLMLAKDEEEVISAGKIAERIIQSVPVWRLRNKGDPESAELTHSVLEKYLEEIG